MPTPAAARSPWRRQHVADLRGADLFEPGERGELCRGQHGLVDFYTERGLLQLAALLGSGRERFGVSEEHRRSPPELVQRERLLGDAPRAGQSGSSERGTI